MKSSFQTTPQEIKYIIQDIKTWISNWDTVVVTHTNRTERIKLRSLSGLAKILGITLCLAGIVTIAFYEGPSLASPSHLQLGHGVNGSAQHPHAHSTGTWIKGCFLLMISSAAWALWLVMQVDHYLLILHRGSVVSVRWEWDVPVDL
ncbi:hypothetical protein Taro_025728 [Colocasia esculenta]|uniref:Uncharacterized protein n=1 Tax=Colocasia esculenta TaxID=4460 RepID=A0A843VD20_COLES|nr:hypothetical protein [Colocasia esculenta]